MTETERTEIERSGLVALYAADQVGGPYIYGATAEPCTIGYRLARAEQYPEYADKIHGNCPALSGEGVGCVGCEWEGRLAHDCAQLTRFAARAAGLTLPSGATSQWNSGDWAASGLIAALPAEHVCFVYRRREGKMVHTGVYMGDGTVCEARGHADGVVRGDVGDYPWTHWAILRGMAVPEGAALMTDRPVLRRGSSGEAVRTLQTILRKAGYSLEVDGKFGSMTRTAVLSFQGTHGLTRDGVVGEMTWAALDAVDKAAPECWTVTISGLTEAVAAQIVAEHGGLMTQEESK